MKTAKVISVKGDGTFNDLYKFDVELDNGDTAKMYKRTPQHWLEEGEEINYTINEKGTLKVIREGWDNKPSTTPYTAKKDNNVQEYIIKQSSLKAAVDLCVAQGIYTPEDVLSRADAFTDWVLDRNQGSDNKAPF